MLPLSQVKICGTNNKAMILQVGFLDQLQQHYLGTWENVNSWALPQTCRSGAACLAVGSSNLGHKKPPRDSALTFENHGSMFC